ncbi:uncharacterized protein LOC144005345 isoform X1 [Festucalex cinctus]
MAAALRHHLKSFDCRIFDGRHFDWKLRCMQSQKTGPNLDKDKFDCTGGAMLRQSGSSAPPGGQQQEEHEALIQNSCAELVMPGLMQGVQVKRAEQHWTPPRRLAAAGLKDTATLWVSSWNC